MDILQLLCIVLEVAMSKKSFKISIAGKERGVKGKVIVTT